MLGEFDSETFGRQVVTPQRFVHRLDERGLHDVHRRNVDRHGPRVPDSRLCAGAVDHPGSESAHDRGVGDSRQEVVGHEDDSIGPVPANQGLDPADAAGAQNNDGLEVEQEFVRG
ncbi:MAG TPA: hypothetical protein VH274_03915 [Mycobacteriales bacterium]|nr:hypothetical protein [Mycobacteriales bacterium]